MSKPENNLERLSDLLENDLAKRLLKEYSDKSGESSLLAVLEQETEQIELKRVENDKTKNN